MIKSLYARSVSLLLLLSVVGTSVPLVATPRVAQAAGADCAAGLAIALGIYKIRFIAGLLDVPAQQNKTAALNNIPDTANEYGQLVVRCVLKPLAKNMIVALIRNVGASVVSWVNSGFKGSPLFVTDYEGTIQDSADQAIGTFIEGSELGFLCNDFSFQIRLALALKYSRPFQEEIKCTLSDIEENIATNGGRGWENLITASIEPQNNVYGAYIIADSALAQKAFRAATVQEDKIAYGQGFLAFESCDPENYESQAEYDKRQAAIKGNANLELGGGGAFKVVATKVTTTRLDSSYGTATASTDFVQSNSKEKICKKPTIKTPGRVIADKLTSTFAQGDIQMAVAQEIDDVVAATMNQIAQKALQGAKGLLGLSKKRSTTPASYLDKYRAQFYGGTIASAGTSGDTSTGARSELDDYRLNSFDEVSVLRNSDPTLQGIDSYTDTNTGTALESDKAVLNSAMQSGTGSTTSSNAALLKTTNQSSGTNAANAVDGIKNTTQYTPGSSTSEDDPSPWWQTDLGESKKIKEVRIWKVPNKPGSQTLETFKVIVGGGAGEWSSSIVNGGQTANPIVVPVNQTGQTVKIEKIATPHACSAHAFDGECYYPLELAEVEVIEEGSVPSLQSAAPGATAEPVVLADSVTGTSTLSWTPSFVSELSLSPTKAINQEIRLNAIKQARNLIVEIGLYKGSANIPILSIFADGFDIVRGSTNGTKSSSQGDIGPSTGTARFGISVDSNSSYSFIIKGSKRVGAESGSYDILSHVIDADGTVLESKTNRINFVVE
ncbi:MAG: discoidin domain-containing protein [Candidatus Paceibacterota bacterium]